MSMYFDYYRGHYYYSWLEEKSSWKGTINNQLYQVATSSVLLSEQLITSRAVLYFLAFFVFSIFRDYDV